MSVVLEAAFEKQVARLERDLRVQGYGNPDGRGVESIPNDCTSPPDRWCGPAGLVGGDQDDLRILELPLSFGKEATRAICTVDQLSRGR